MNLVIRFFIKIYQLIVSPLLSPRCRFLPSCSEYAHECFKGFPFMKALWYSGKRILKCHPWGDSGYDPIPKQPKGHHEH